MCRDLSVMCSFILGAEHSLVMKLIDMSLHYL
jgi:hypothetical protein